jgi:uncharacterized membrane protein
MDVFLAEWLNLIIRWAHMIVGIGWIGTSFYFIALDYSLRRIERDDPALAGSAWQVHGGGFYFIQKYKVAPAALPPQLHWFKWEAYLTWVTGFALLAVQYYWNATAYLIDPSVMRLAPWQAIAISVVSLLAGWAIYDGLCRSPLGSNTPVLAVLVFGLVVAAAWLYTHVFSGRGAFIHVGALVGTIMAANVFMVIIPNQKKMVAQLIAGQTPDPKYGATGKQRSLHNTYLTLPVLVMMVSSHYPFLFSHPHNWLVVALILVVGGLARYVMVMQEAGEAWSKFGWAAPATVVALLATIVVTAPRSTTYAGSVSEGEALRIAQVHCATCHARKPTHEGFNEAPKGIAIESVADLRQYAALIAAQAVQGNAMPLGNETAMTDEERAKLGAFLKTITP